MFSCLDSVANLALTSSISGAASGEMKVESVRALRCRFALGGAMESPEGRGLRREVRTVAAGAVPFWEGENMMDTLLGNRRRSSFVARLDGNFEVDDVEILSLFTLGWHYS